MKTWIIQLMAGLALVAGAIGCQKKVGANTVNEQSSQQGIADSIKSQNKVFMQSFQQKDTARFADLYTEDGWMMPPNAPTIKGREGVKQFLGQAQKMGLKRIKLHTGKVFLQSDSAAIETGSYQLYAGNGQQVDQGSYMVYWKNEDGTWRLFRDIWNSDMPPASQQKSQKK